ncbi:MULTISPECIES: TetR/AcrR family transcriptional regulator C-terminal domain-containing protein [Halomonadaceae]|jgi:TetR/AcrR family transcriptional regulator, tetracycline repressor protein|uniref:TetR/AcrR family transcriptional regulator C-terminal domain-containing protein n=1 Tax=Halomonadaceae TaxID=28256 RepID=UPI0012F3A42D|nr:MULTISPECIES: TetR/AcrR family transcriptional regulator C-terminal domain-containing protein [Halomonas]CAD5269397.1 Transcriptional regulator, TetR family [Halomonas sp. I3]CAD5275288.1 Transcriptional regulator, TetR family [Halomonas sp. 113]CAD5276619.1 Transcriptional regulator, TetR family [Halomonas sp. 156]CAD5277036.1 Transcriptional regulator, TetR family [Halomonas sp. 59]VXB99765.1 Transcriptional regulator, TetR family [Halomonas titanicae]
MATKAPRIERSKVIETALSLLDQYGIEGLTMRKLAQALQIQAPSLYWHFENKQSLIDGMADALVDGVAKDLPEAQPWEDRVRQVAVELRLALLRHRDGARVFEGTYVVTDNVLRTGEAMISAFMQAGADAELAATSSFTVTYYLLGLVMEEQALGPESNLDLAARKQTFLDSAREKHPHSWAAREAIFSEDFDGRFATGLDLLIAGIKQQITVPHHRL